MIRNLAQAELRKRWSNLCPDKFMEWAFGKDYNNVLQKDAPGQYCSLHPDCEPISITDPITDGTKSMVDEYIKSMKQEVVAKYNG